MTLSEELKAGFNAIHREAKTSLTVRVVTRTRDNEDDITESNSDTTVEGVVMPIEDFYSEEEAGMLAQGTHVAFFKSSVSNLSITNNIVKGSDVFNIKRVENAESNGQVVYQMCVLEKR